jgi:hypothetical protein
MFCHFCGKNFDRTEGFEEISRNGHHFVRCEKCGYEKCEVEYDWHMQMYGRGQRWHAPAQTASRGGVRKRSRS